VQAGKANSILLNGYVLKWVELRFHFTDAANISLYGLCSWLCGWVTIFKKVKTIGHNVSEKDLDSTAWINEDECYSLLQNPKVVSKSSDWCSAQSIRAILHFWTPDVTSATTLYCWTETALTAYCRLLVKYQIYRLKHELFLDHRLSFHTKVGGRRCVPYKDVVAL
jgi:hypothetical protein